MRPSMSAITSCAVVGLGLPERFALGAASGNPHAAITARASGCEGMRTEAVSKPGTDGIRHLVRHGAG